MHLIAPSLATLLVLCLHDIVLFLYQLIYPLCSRRCVIFLSVCLNAGRVVVIHVQFNLCCLLFVVVVLKSVCPSNRVAFGCYFLFCLSIDSSSPSHPSLHKRNHNWMIMLAVNVTIGGTQFTFNVPPFKSAVLHLQSFFAVLSLCTSFCLKVPPLSQSFSNSMVLALVLNSSCDSRNYFSESQSSYHLSPYIKSVLTHISQSHNTVLIGQSHDP